MVRGGLSMLAGLACALVPTLALVPAHGAIVPAAVESTVDRAELVRRAETTLANARKWLGTGNGTGLYRESYRRGHEDRSIADEWPYSQVHIGVLDLTNVPGVGARFLPALAEHHRALMLYWVPRSANGLPGFASRVGAPHGPGGDLYYDDNDWVGLAAMQHWLLHKDADSLELAKKIFALVSAAWDDDPAHPLPGGLFWTQQPGNLDRNTVSNMPAAQLGVRLYQATGDKAYLDAALRFYDWANRNMQRPDGLFIDHVGIDGKLDTRVFSYNQGVPVGVNVVLYQATGDAKYLAEARRIAEASLAYFDRDDRMDRQPKPFNAIWFKNLLLLESVTGGTRYRDAMAAYADRMWRHARDRRTGLFGRTGPKADGKFHLIDQGAMIQIFAVLAWDPKDYGALY